MKAELQALLATHARRIDYNHPGYGNCRCGFAVEHPQDHHAHVTEHIIYELGLYQECRQLADGEGGISTNYETGVTTSHSVPCTQQTRWATKWKTTDASKAMRAAAGKST